MILAEVTLISSKLISTGNNGNTQQWAVVVDERRVHKNHVIIKRVSTNYHTHKAQDGKFYHHDKLTNQVIGPFRDLKRP